MRKQLLILMGVGLSGALSAQSISPDVYGSSGEVNQVGATQVSWTIGEPVTETITGSGNQITQGFHQPTYTLVALDDPLASGFTLDVFPNPATDRVFLQFEREEEIPMQVDLVTLNGQLISGQRTSELAGKLGFDLSALSQGAYFLRIRTDHGTFNAFKIQKTN